jgi:hypothetical protein
MLASESQLMPDPPDKGRPSSAPLSIEDADRLADSFTAFWEDAGAPATAGPIAAPHPGAVTAPMPAVAPINKPVGKQTLLGIAPVAIEKRPPASQPPPAAPVAKPVSTPPAALPPPVIPVATPVSTAPSATSAVPEQPSPPVAAVPQPHKQTMRGFYDPSTGAPVPRAAVAPEAVLQSTPDVPGYAIAYTPKDPPSTPAVVIAPDAQSSPENEPPEHKRQFSQTVPSRVRSAPTASVAPLPAPPLTDDFNPYAPKKGKGKLALGLTGALLLLLAAVGVRTLGGESRELAAPSVPRTDVVSTTTAVAAAPTPAPAEPATVATANPTPTPLEPKASDPVPAVMTARRAHESAPTKAKTKKADTASAAPRPVTRTLEPSPTPAKPARPASGVIVRDAPF